MAKWYFYDGKGKKQGPFNEKNLRFFVLTKRILPNTQMENDAGEKGAAGDIPTLFPVSAPAPPSAPVPPGGNVSTPVSPAESAGVQQGIFCTGCGTHFGQDTPQCPYCGSDTAKNNRFCHKCGREISSGQVVCSHCGTPVYIPDDGSSPLGFSF